MNTLTEPKEQKQKEKGIIVGVECYYALDSVKRKGNLGRIDGRGRRREATINCNPIADSGSSSGVKEKGSIVCQ